MWVLGLDANEPTGPSEFARAATPGLWRQNLTSDERRAAEEIMGERPAALGYPVYRSRLR